MREREERSRFDVAHLARCDVVMCDAVQPCDEFASHVSTDEKCEHYFQAEKCVDEEINVRRRRALCSQNQRQHPLARVEQPCKDVGCHLIRGLMRNEVLDQTDTRLWQDGRKNS